METEQKLEKIRRSHQEKESQELEQLRQRQAEAEMELEELKRKREERRKVREEEEHRKEEEEQHRLAKEEVIGTNAAQIEMLSIVMCITSKHFGIPLDIRNLKMWVLI